MFNKPGAVGARGLQVQDRSGLHSKIFGLKNNKEWGCNSMVEYFIECASVYIVFDPSMGKMKLEKGD